MRCYLERDIDNIVKVTDRITRLVSGLNSADTVKQEVTDGTEYIKKILLQQTKEQ